MNLRKRIAAWIAGEQPALPPVMPATPELGRLKLRIRDDVVIDAGMPSEGPHERLWALPDLAPGVVPKGKRAPMAMDDQITQNFAWAAQSAFSEGMEYMPLTYLAECSQRAEYRRPVEIIAREATRKWMKLVSTGDEDKTDKLKIIEAEFKRLNVQKCFRKCIELDGIFGRAHLFIDMGDTFNTEELKTQLRDSPNKIGIDSLRKLTVVEPLWVTPLKYNSSDPLRDDYLKADSWLVMGTEVSYTRLLTFVSKPVPDIIKPVYQFGGLSLIQMGKPYVDNWLRTRQSVSDLIHSFSTPVLKTNLSQILNGGAADYLWKRLMVFTRARDNRGVMAVDKNEEDFTNVTTPLSTLDKLQAQAQEQMSSVFGIPLIILFGITPSGLTATSEGELDVFEAAIGALQEQLLTPNLSRILNIVQLSKFGEIDPEIGFEWEPLGVLDELQEANVRKTDADTDGALIDAGVITPMEARVRLAAAVDSPYAGLDLTVIPEEPAPENPFGGPQLDEDGNPIPGSEQPPPDNPEDDKPDVPGHPGAKQVEGAGGPGDPFGGKKPDTATAGKQGAEFKGPAGGKQPPKKGAGAAASAFGKSA